VRFIFRLLLNAVALGVATWLVPGITVGTHEPVRTVVTIVFVALVFGVVNAVVKPVFKFVTAPLVWLSLGLFLLVINGLLLMLTSWLSGLLGLGWHVEGFWTAVLGALIVSVVSFLLDVFLPGSRDRERRD